MKNWMKQVLAVAMALPLTIGAVPAAELGTSTIALSVSSSQTA